jgi:signal transduction histidine kinase/CheY-like chemotaxis protein
MSVAVKYASAVGIAGVAVVLRWLLVPLVGPDAPYATMMGAVALTVWMAGWGPAAVTAVLGLIGTGLVIGRPLGTLPVDTLHTVVGFVLYASTCGLIIGLGEAMRRTRDAYRRSQERFLRSQEAAIQGHAWLKSLREANGDITDFEIEYINPLGASICGSNPEQAVGRRVTELMPGSCNAGLLESLREVVRTGQPADIELAPDPATDTTDAAPAWLRYMIVKVEDGIALSFSDITQNKQLALELKSRAADLQRANSIKSLFLATLSHELRNPLAPIRNGLAILKERIPEHLGDIPAMMDRQMRIATRLIDDLLDASRIDRGKLELRRENVSLESVVDAAVETARPNIEAKSHELLVNHGPGHLRIDADPTRLAQVIANLLNNSAKFTPPGGRIVLSVRGKAGFATVRVRDNGIGIAAADLDSIFEMFVQLDASKTQAGAGLGLGLALARSLITLHGGQITAHSAGPGKGSEFRIRLPLAEAEACLPTPIARHLPGHASRSVLVVDDNVDAATSLATLLQHRGHQVRACFDGSAAFEQASLSVPEVAFVDLNMPAPDGIELCRMIRSQAWGQHIKLIALTGMGQPDDLERSRSAGFDLHLTKPVNPDELLVAIATLPHQGGTAIELASRAEEPVELGSGRTIERGPPPVALSRASGQSLPPDNRVLSRRRPGAQ